MENPLEIFDDSAWQMSRGERAALEGLLAAGRPGLACAIGGGPGAMARLALHAREVHAFEFIAPQRDDRAGHVALHLGDPAELLADFLAGLADAGRNVDFVLLDGDATPDGPRRILELLLESPALGRGALLVHQVNNPRVRAGLDAVRFGAWPKVALVESDFVPGYMLAEDPLRHELWGGLALVLIDAARLRFYAGGVVDERCYPAAALFAEVRDGVIARERLGGPGAPYPGPSVDRGSQGTIDRLRRELAASEHEVRRLRSVARHHEELWRSMMDSWSWRLTAPIRVAKERSGS